MSTSQPPAYPGSSQAGVPFYGIVTRRNILQDFTTQWIMHTHWTVETVERTMRALSGFTGQDDYVATDAYYRRARFDIATSYIRAWDKNQPVPLNEPSQITNVVGRQLVVLLDQHISIATAIAGANLAAAGLVPADAIPPLLVALGLVPNVAAAATYDPVADVLLNGKNIVGLLANVYKHMTNLFAFNKSKLPSDILIYNGKNVAAFSDFLQRDPYFQDQRAMTVSELQAAGLPLQDWATDAWSHHLASVVNLITKEIAFDLAAKAKVNAANTAFPLVNADTMLTLHGTYMGNLFFASLGHKPSSTGPMKFPGYAKIPESFNSMPNPSA